VCSLCIIVLAQEKILKGIAIRKDAKKNEK
jgi:hypothetical protein